MESADAVVIFDDQRCPDTLAVRGRAVKLGKPLRVVAVPAVAAGKAYRGRW